MHVDPHNFPAWLSEKDQETWQSARPAVTSAWRERYGDDDSFEEFESHLQFGHRAAIHFDHPHWDEKLEVETGVGVTSVKLTGSREDYNYKIQCGAGSVNIDGDQYSSLGVERKIDNRAARSMELECGVGTIEVQFTGSL